MTRRAVPLWAVLAAVSLLAACAGGPAKPKPADLVALAPVVVAKPLWSAKVPAIAFALQVQVHGDKLTLAASDGTVLQLDAASGRELWRQAVGSPLAAGVGSDGQLSAVVTQANELVALQEGRVLWRQRLSTQAYTAPLVAGARVFVLSADRAVSAYDGRTGARLWTQQRPGNDPLVLRQAGVILPVGDTLVAGLSGRLLGLNPLNGSVRWDAAIATPRGINEVERLVDLVGPAARLGNVVCARAFQAAVGCVNTEAGTITWTRQSDGLVGLAVDERQVFGTESNSTVQTWRRSDGERGWSSDRLRFRELTAPLVVGRSVAVGDYQGYVHFLSREDGSLQSRLSTDGSAVVATPLMAGNTLVVVTAAGGVFGFSLP
jgi:outer membrane protein assembly factor BamB